MLLSSNAITSILGGNGDKIKYVCAGWLGK